MQMDAVTRDAVWPDPKWNIGYIRLNVLINYKLRIPLDAIVEPDSEGFIARAVDLPLYGTGEDPLEALTILKQEIESLFDDLVADDQFTPDWLRVRDFLKQAIEK